MKLKYIETIKSLVETFITRQTNFNELEGKEYLEKAIEILDELTFVLATEKTETNYTIATSTKDDSGLFYQGNITSQSEPKLTLK